MANRLKAGTIIQSTDHAKQFIFCSYLKDIGVLVKDEDENLIIVPKDCFIQIVAYEIDLSRLSISIDNKKQRSKA